MLHMVYKYEIADLLCQCPDELDFLFEEFYLTFLTFNPKLVKNLIFFLRNVLSEDVFFLTSRIKLSEDL